MRHRLALTIIAAAVLAAVLPQTAGAQAVLVPMDLGQTNHLKAYGLAYRALVRGHNVQWLLNYRGGSFLMPAAEDVLMQCRVRLHESVYHM